MNETLELLTTRVSAPRLVEPGPSASELRQMYMAALRAPDHGQLRPWRFLHIEGSGRQHLGDLFVTAAQQKDPALSKDQAEKLRKKPLRAPLIVIVVAKTQKHPNVPKSEQWMSAACGAHSLLLAANSLGYAAMWRTGGSAYDQTIATGLGLNSNEQIVGFIYVGTAAVKKPVPTLSVDDFVAKWPD